MTDIMEVIAPDIEKESFEIRDLSAANWAAGVITRKEQKKAEIDAVADELHKRVDEWARKAKEDHDTSYLEELLRTWVWNEIQGEKKKSVKLFGATAGFRHTPDKVEVFDAQKAEEYCHDNHAELLHKKITFTLDKRGVKDLAERTGELIPGVEIKPGYDKFYIDGDK